MLPPFLFRSVAMRGAMSGAMNCLRGQRGGCKQNRGGGVNTPPSIFSPLSFGFFVLDRTTRAALAGRESTGATPPF